MQTSYSTSAPRRADSSKSVWSPRRAIVALGGGLVVIAVILFGGLAYGRWTATVAGHSVKPTMLAPSFVGVPVSRGTHVVVFQYRPSSSYPLYFAIGVLALAALVAAPILLRRGRARSASVEGPPSAG